MGSWRVVAVRCVLVLTALLWVGAAGAQHDESNRATLPPGAAVNLVNSAKEAIDGRNYALCLQHAQHSFEISPTKTAAAYAAFCAVQLEDDLALWDATHLADLAFPDWPELPLEKTGLARADMDRIRQQKELVRSRLNAVEVVPEPKDAELSYTGAGKWIRRSGVVYAEHTSDVVVTISKEGYRTETRQLPDRGTPNAPYEYRVALARAGLAVAPRSATPAQQPHTIAPERNSEASDENVDPDLDARLSGASSPSSNRRALAISGWTALAGGGLAAVLGTSYWLKAAETKANLEKNCPSRMGCAPSLEASYEDAQDGAKRGNILVPAGAAVAVVGFVLLLVRSKVTETSSFTLGINSVGGGAIASVRGSM